MPKLKTHKGAKKRIHVTGTGKFLQMKQLRNNHRTKRRKAVKRLYSKKSVAHSSNTAGLKRVLPYS